MPLTDQEFEALRDWLTARVQLMISQAEGQYNAPWHTRHQVEIENVVSIWMSAPTNGWWLTRSITSGQFSGAGTSTSPTPLAMVGSGTLAALKGMLLNGGLVFTYT